MAFTWTDAANLASSGAQLYQAFAGQRESDASKDARKAARRASGYAEAAADPGSAQFQNLVALYDEANRRAATDQIDRIQKMDRRARARGDIGFAVNNERRDEARYKALADQFMLAKERARQEARNTLMGSSQLLSQSAGAQPVGTSEARAGSNFDRTIAGISSVGPFVEALSEWYRKVNRPDQGPGYAADPQAPRGTPGGPIGSTVIGYG